MRGGIRVGRVMGIPLGISPSWFIALALIVTTLSMRVLPDIFPDYGAHVYWLLGLAATLLFFASIVVHELAHSLVAVRHGIPVKGITLFVFGGVSQIARDAPRPRAELLIAVVGPLTSLAIGGACYVAWAATGHSDRSAALVLLQLLFVMNVALGLFNLAPGFPMDGGRLVRAVLWGITRDFVRATRWASFTGRFLGYALVLAGALSLFGIGLGPLTTDQVGGLWFVLIGLFLDSSARASYAQVRLLNELRSHTVGEAMSRDIMTIPPGLTLEALVNDYMVEQQRTCLFVVDAAGAVMGVVTPKEVRSVPRLRWGEARVSEVMAGTSAVTVTAPRTDMATAMLAMEGEDLFQLPVVDEGRLIGVLDRVHVLQAIQKIRPGKR